MNEKETFPRIFHHLCTMVAMKFSWIILLALFVAVVHCGNSQSRKVPYQQLTGFTKSDCKGDLDVICKNKALAEYCDILKTCKEHIRKKTLDQYRIG